MQIYYSYMYMHVTCMYINKKEPLGNKINARHMYRVEIIEVFVVILKLH